MREPASPIERLDLAARARANQGLISCLKVGLPLLTLLCIVLASISEAPRRETLLVTMLAIVGLIATLILWLSQRYKLYGAVIVCFAFVIENLLSRDHPPHHTVIGWFADLLPALFFFLLGFRLVCGGPSLCDCQWKRMAKRERANRDVVVLPQSDDRKRGRVPDRKLLDRVLDLPHTKRRRLLARHQVQARYSQAGRMPR